MAHGIQVCVPPDLERVSAHSLNALARFISDQEYSHASIPIRLRLRRRTERKETKKVEGKGENNVIEESRGFSMVILLSRDSRPFRCSFILKLGSFESFNFIYLNILAVFYDV